MCQGTQRRIAEKIKSTLDSDALPFHEILDVEMVESALTSEGVQFKDRIYTPFVTLCLFLSQVLDQDHSCRAAVMRGWSSGWRLTIASRAQRKPRATARRAGDFR